MTQPAYNIPKYIIDDEDIDNYECEQDIAIDNMITSLNEYLQIFENILKKNLEEQHKLMHEMSKPYYITIPDYMEPHKKYFIDNVEEELISKVCHPDNYHKFEDLGFFE